MSNDNNEINVAVYNGAIAIYTAYPDFDEAKSMEIAAGLAAIAFDDLVLANIIRNQIPESDLVDYLRNRKKA